MYQKSQNYSWPTPGSSAPRPARHAAGSEDNTGWQGHFQPHRTGSEGGVTVPLPGGTSEDGEMLAMAPSVKRKTATTESNSGKKEPRTSRGQRKETQRNTPNATKTPQMPPKRHKRHQTPQTPPNATNATKHRPGPEPLSAQGPDHFAGFSHQKNTKAVSEEDAKRGLDPRRFFPVLG